LGLNPVWAYSLRLVAAMATLAALSRPLLRFSPRMPAASLALGAAVFAIWVAPDALFQFIGIIGCLTTR